MTDLFTIQEKKEQKPVIMRDYQSAATDAAISYLKSNSGNPIICAATGTGKSIIIASLIQRIITANAGARVMVATHVAELVFQNSEKLKSIMSDADIGIYSAGLGLKESGNQIIFAGIQSVYRAKNLGKINLLIIDECHTISKKDISIWASLITVLKDLNPRLKIIGLSATPFRLDSGSLTGDEDSLFDDIIYDYGLGRAIQDGWLCPLTTKYTATTYNIEGVGKIGGEYNLKQLEAATNTDDMNARAVAEMVEKGADRKSWLIFCNGVQHSFAIRDEIRKYGITCETVTGETPDNERDRILQDFKSGKIRAVTNNAVWTTGIDVPGVDLIGMLRHTMSGGLLLQMAGRGTRATIDLTPYCTAKERRDAIADSDCPNCLFLDFAKNIERHGFLDQIKAKEKGKKGDGVPPMKACPECFTICHAAAKYCKDCGFVFPVNEETSLSSAHGGAVLSKDDKRIVVGVIYSAHNVFRKGKTPCLKVKYQHDDGSETHDYVCLQHEGFAKQKADKWWKERNGEDISGLKIEDIVNRCLCDQIKVPSEIVVKKEGNYDRIINYKNLQYPVKGFSYSLVDPDFVRDEITADDDFDIAW